jgi:hypothetical protein
MKTNFFPFIAFFVVTAILASCAGYPKPYRDQCAVELDLAWQELSIAKAEGFAGTVSYSKALSLLTAAKTMQTVENFDNCTRHARDARYYINESRQGR